MSRLHIDWLIDLFIDWTGWLIFSWWFSSVSGSLTDWLIHSFIHVFVHLFIHSFLQFVIQFSVESGRRIWLIFTQVVDCFVQSYTGVTSESLYSHTQKDVLALYRDEDDIRPLFTKEMSLLFVQCYMGWHQARVHERGVLAFEVLYEMTPALCSQEKCPCFV